MRIETQPLYTFVVMKAFELARIEVQRSSSHVGDRLEGERHRTLLGTAVNNKDHHLMKLLLDNGAIPNDHSWPPASTYLALAIEKEHPLMVRTLIDGGAGPICAVPGNLMVQHSLQYALQKSHCDQDVIDCILSRAPYLYETEWPEVLTEALFVSHDRGYHSTESSLLGRLKAVVNDLVQSKWSATAHTCGDAFVAACGHGELALIQILMDGVNLTRSEKNATAFEAAIKNGHIEAVRLLLNHGIMVNLPVDGIATTAITIASERGHEEIVSLLLGHGACWNNAIFSAARIGHAKIVQMLLDFGADPNTRGDYYISFDEDDEDPRYFQRRSTTLHMAVSSGNEEVVRILLNETRTDVDALDENGEHALFLAVTRDYIECVRLLLGAEIALEHLNNAAAIAAFEERHEVLAMLLAKGATLQDESSQA
jgi:ankyrin repeat protein